MMRNCTNFSCLFSQQLKFVGNGHVTDRFLKGYKFDVLKPISLKYGLIATSQLQLLECMWEGTGVLGMWKLEVSRPE